MDDNDKPQAPFHPGDDAPVGVVHNQRPLSPEEIKDLEKGDNDKDGGDSDSDSDE